MTAVFFFGTLRDPDLRAVVLGREPAGRLGPARVPGHRAAAASGGAYPVLVTAPGQAAEGLLAEGLGPEALDRLRFFEGGFGYEAQAREVLTEDGARQALVFVADPSGEAAGDWDLAGWKARHKPFFLEVAREAMGHFGTPAAERIAGLMPGIRRRAWARARASASPTTPSLGSRRGPEDVTAGAPRYPYAGFFSVEEHALQHRRFDGDVTGTLIREAFGTGDAATVLPWDPRRDRVLLIEQFRAAPFARRDPNPWLIEAIAGLIDPGETAESTARREAVEEAGVTLGRLKLLGRYYSSPGALAELTTSFVGEADLPEAEARHGHGHGHGLASEGEDIRRLVVPFGRAMAAVRAGEIRNAPLMLSLLALARIRPRLKRAWGDARTVVSGRRHD